MTRRAATIVRLAHAATLAIAVSACEMSKSRTATSPSIAGPLEGVEIAPPMPMSPNHGAEVLNTEPVRLVFDNAVSNSERSFWYVVELAADGGFGRVLYTNPRVAPTSGQQTSVVIDGGLTPDATYYWRVKADDGANTSDFSPTARFDLVVPVVIAPPAPLSPANGETTANGTPEMVLRNGRVQGRAGRVEYEYQIARDPAFTDVVSVARVERSGGSETTHPSAALPAGVELFWRALGTNGPVTSPWSAVQTFRTPAPPPPPPSQPPPSSRSCESLTGPYEILVCHRQRYGSSMSHDEHASFLRDSVRQFNQAGVPGGPFGLLRKRSGNNCGGYSCDVICSGQGDAQRQYDVLIDEDRPTWSGRPIGPDIRVDVCEIQ